MDAQLRTSVIFRLLEKNYTRRWQFRSNCGKISFFLLLLLLLLAIMLLLFVATVASVRRKVLPDLEEETMCTEMALGYWACFLSSNLNLVLWLPVAIGFDGKHVSKFTFSKQLAQGWRRMCIRWCVHNILYSSSRVDAPMVKRRNG